VILADKRQAHIEAYECTVRPSYNKRGHHTWWDDGDYDDVTARCGKGLPPPVKHAVTTPTPAPNPTGSSSSSRSATSHLGSSIPLALTPRGAQRGMPGISFRALKKVEPPSPLWGNLHFQSPATSSSSPRTSSQSPHRHRHRRRRGVLSTRCPPSTATPTMEPGHNPTVGAGGRRRHPR
jgi:hypothetical protein